MDVVIQGLVYPYTWELIDNFKQVSFIEKIIVSTWEGQSVDADIVIYNEDVENPGIGNRNRQIKSTQEGLKLVASPICAKFRTDQMFPVDTLYKMNEYYLAHKNDQKIFTLGLYRNWPFHPRDHMFWGPTDKMRQLFDCPFDPELNIYVDYARVLRAEAWLGCNYAAKYDTIVAEMLKDYKSYFVDNAPKLHEAFEIHSRLYHQLFWPFPRLHYSWEKVGLTLETGYYYDYTKTHSEYWAEDING